MDSWLSPYSNWASNFKQEVMHVCFAKCKVVRDKFSELVACVPQENSNYSADEFLGTQDYAFKQAIAV